MDRLM
jgi:hypothetical protein